MDSYSKRLLALQASLIQESLDGLIISNRQNLSYLIGLNQLHPHNREAIMLVRPNQQLLYHSAFLKPPSLLQNLTTQIMSPQNPPQTIISDFFSHSRHIGIEATDYTVAEADRLKSWLKPTTKLVPTYNLIEDIRILKDATENQLMVMAGSLTQRLMRYAFNVVRSHYQSHRQLTELDLSLKIQGYSLKLGATELAFPTVVAFGAHTSDPHHQPTNTPLKTGPVLIDLGMKYQGYCSDMTRTIWINSPPPPRFQGIKKAVDAAYISALNQIYSHFPQSKILTINSSPHLSSKISDQSSLFASDVDLAARSVIQKAGYADQFIHTTGHGLGLSIHESPSLSAANHTPLKPGMVITIEPGIYLPGSFGYRYENTIALL